MNLFYTGLGIARCLGARGVRVIGLTAGHGVFGNFTRYADVRHAPDSRTHPDALLRFLLNLGSELGRGVLYPTRDDDLIFLNRFRSELSRHFSLVIPEPAALETCLGKWRTHQAACAAGVPSPQSWLVESEEDLPSVAREVTYPCVVKPLIASHWRKPGNWDLVGRRKAIRVSSPDELAAEYRTVSQADPQCLVQELIPGGDESLVMVGCLMSREFDWVAAFNTQKLRQEPEELGTGCIVQVVERPGLFERTARLLRSLQFSGIAEVEYKWDARKNAYMLIEINPRPWDQHRLGWACGVDLIYLAYCEHACLPVPAAEVKSIGQKWIAEDTFITTAVRLLWRRSPKLRTLFSLARGRRIYAIWDAGDPLPFLVYALRLVPDLVVAVWRSDWIRTARIAGPAKKEAVVQSGHLEKQKG